MKRASLSALSVVIIIYLAMIQALAVPASGPIGQKPSSPTEVLPGDALIGSDRVYPFRDAYTLVPYGHPMVHALLSVAQTRMRQVRQGGNPSGEELFAVDIRLYNDDGDQRSFYNVDWDRLIPLPGCLALYDAHKHYVCDLLDNSMGGSAAPVGAGAWFGIPAEGYMGKTVYASLPYPSYKVVPAGTYYLQVIYHSSVIQPPSKAKNIHYGDYTELFRSNVVTITVVDQPPVNSFKRPTGIISKLHSV